MSCDTLGDAVLGPADQDMKIRTAVRNGRVTLLVHPVGATGKYAMLAPKTALAIACGLVCCAVRASLKING